MAAIRHPAMVGLRVSRDSGGTIRGTSALISARFPRFAFTKDEWQFCRHLGVMVCAPCYPSESGGQQQHHPACDAGLQCRGHGAARAPTAGGCCSPSEHDGVEPLPCRPQSCTQLFWRTAGLITLTASVSPPVKGSGAVAITLKSPLETPTEAHRIKAKCFYLLCFRSLIKTPERRKVSENKAAKGAL